MLISIDDYENIVSNHLAESATLITWTKLQEIYSSVQMFLHETKPNLSHDEYLFLEESLKSHAIPMPQLLIKDHKPPNKTCTYPTWLVIPAMNFFATFSKIGYSMLKALLDKNRVNYSCTTINQALDLKCTLEN